MKLEVYTKGIAERAIAYWAGEGELTEITVDGEKWRRAHIAPAEPVPIDLCERPEPETEDEIWWIDNSNLFPEPVMIGTWGELMRRSDPAPWRSAWRRRRLFTSRKATLEAIDRDAFVADALNARDAINGERGLPGLGGRCYVLYVPTAGQDGVEFYHEVGTDVISNWRFHTKADAERWLEAIGGPDAFKRLIEVTV